MVAQLKKCMLGDYEIPEFQRKWDHMVNEFGLQENTWVNDLYEKRNMWATTYIGGRFFAGIRTISRCEGLNAQLARLASRMFTRAVFKLFRHALTKGSTVKVKSAREIMSQTIFTVSKYGKPKKEWKVSYLDEPFHVRCSCQMMESFGLPCEHIIGVMVHLNIEDIPQCLVLDRWIMGAKEKFYDTFEGCKSVWDSVYTARCGALEVLCRKMIRLAAKSSDIFDAIRDLVCQQIKIMGETEDKNDVDDNNNDNVDDVLHDPVKVGTKGCGGTAVSIGPRARR
ncbi:Zinc finger, PMZ-type [Sesbania bispinosa]|nr:Zinc finger, PMZ-type [Sesbania bispinosa]